MKKTRSTILIGAVLISAIFFAVVPSAFADSMPRLMKIDKMSSHSFVADVKLDSKLKNKTVVLKFKLKDAATGDIMYREYVTKADKHRMATTTVMGLSPSKQYWVWVKARKITLSDFSSYSNKRMVATKGSVAAPTGQSTEAPASSEQTQDTSQNPPAQ
jgi:hypothetical protein